jgi:23S rRNA (adenine2503-C2)-methyltransferase
MSSVDRPLHPLARTPAEWSERLASLGERGFRAQQVFRWLHGRGVLDPAQMTDLPGSLRQKLAEDGLGPTAAVAELRRSLDGTRKLLVRMNDGMTVESVLIPAVSGPGKPGEVLDADASAADDEDEESEGREGGEGAVEKVRVTQCISTQVGCAMGCVFCASGVAGLKRHLGPEEIVGQVILGKTLLDEGEALRNVVLMGMGEPLHNYEATARALRLLTNPQGVALSSRRVTVSTSGLVPEIRRLGEDFRGQIGLAISLHAADDETRSRLMPINRKYPLAQLLQALRDYPLPPRRRITIEYTLVSGKNDSIEEAGRLASLLHKLRVKINLIPMNPIDASTLGPPDWDRVYAFQNELISRGYSCFIRRQRGDDVAAACGQLALRGAAPKVRVHRGLPRPRFVRDGNGGDRPLARGSFQHRGAAGGWYVGPFLQPGAESRDARSVEDAGRGGGGGSGVQRGAGGAVAVGAGRQRGGAPGEIVRRPALRRGSDGGLRDQVLRYRGERFLQRLQPGR